MKLTLEQWDAQVKPHLTYIEAGASMAARHARALPVKTAFKSFAQDELEAARKVLESALAEIIAAEATYERKPAEGEHAT
jgi:hypothetical protein